MSGLASLVGVIYSCVYECFSNPLVICDLHNGDVTHQNSLCLVFTSKVLITVVSGSRMNLEGNVFFKQLCLFHLYRFSFVSR